MSTGLLLRNKNEPFIGQIVTCDEKWIFSNKSATFRSVAGLRLDTIELSEVETTPKIGYDLCLVVCIRSYPSQFSKSERNKEVLSPNRRITSENMTTGVGQQKKLDSSSRSRQVTRYTTDAPSALLPGPISYHSFEHKTKAMVKTNSKT